LQEQIKKINKEFKGKQKLKLNKNENKRQL